jgi:Na+/melibiose symporter-like transporter
MKDVIEDRDKDFFKSLKNIFKHKSYLYLLMTFLCVSLSFQLIQTNIALYCKYSINAKDQYQFIIITLLISSIIFLPIWFKIMNKYGKKSSFAYGIIIMIPCLFILFYFEKPSNIE